MSNNKHKKGNVQQYPNMPNNNEIEGIDKGEIEALQNALKKDESGVMNAMVSHILNTFNSQGYNFRSVDEILEYMQTSMNNNNK